jgi:rod shape determining protein RodA
MFALGDTERQSKVEWLQLLALLGLMAVGVLFIYSATLAHQANSTPWYKEAFFRQMVWYAIGGTGAVALCLLDYRILARWGPVFYWGTVLSLALVLIPGIGTTHGWGARRWIDLGPFQFQPSEFAKLGFIFAFANFLSRPVEELHVPAVFFKALGMAALPFLLIMKEPDLGSALIFMPVTLMMMYVAGTPVRFLRRVLFVGGVLVLLFLVDVLFAPPQ